MNFKLKTTLAMAAMLALPLAQAANITKAEHKAGKERISADYKAAKAACDSLSGNAKDVCVAEAKAAHDKAKADLKANKQVAEAQSDAMETKLKADYKVANERCDALSGDAKDSCQASAKARYFQ